MPMDFHTKLAVVPKHIGRLQAALCLAQRGVRMQRDAARRPVPIREFRAFPTMEQSRLAGLFGPADTRTKLPGVFGCLPDGEIHRLLVRSSERSQIGIGA